MCGIGVDQINRLIRQILQVGKALGDRIIKTLKELKNYGEFDIVVGRELTKKFETIYRGKIDEIIEKIKPIGEFVIAIKKP